MTKQTDKTPAPNAQPARKKAIENMNTAKFNPQELCSRKLWQLVQTLPEQKGHDRELSAAIAELAKRRRYLEQLQESGKLGDLNRG
jgi:hypothetical protein